MRGVVIKTKALRGGVVIVRICALFVCLCCSDIWVN